MMNQKRMNVPLPEDLKEAARTEAEAQGDSQLVRFTDVDPSGD